MTGEHSPAVLLIDLAYHSILTFGKIITLQIGTSTQQMRLDITRTIVIPGLVVE